MHPKTQKRQFVLFEGSYKDVQGNGAMGYDYNSGYRISECYAKLAKNIAGELKKIRNNIYLRKYSIMG